jgi:hypothetical protein
MMGNGVRKATPEIMEILLNKEAIAVNQDPLGRRCATMGIWKSGVNRFTMDHEPLSCSIVVTGKQIWVYFGQRLGIQST